MRVFAYVPQIYKAATDKNGASAISRSTWSLFLVAHVATVGYALVNRSDHWLALCFGGNALCCLAILTIAWWNARRHTRSVVLQNPAACLKAAKQDSRQFPVYGISAIRELSGARHFAHHLETTNLSMISSRPDDRAPMIAGGTCGIAMRTTSTP